MSDTLYIKMDRSVEVTVPEVTIGDVAKLTCQNQNIINKVKPLKLIKGNTNKKQRYIISIMKIIEMVQNECPGIVISNIGETDCVVEMKKGKDTNTFLQNFKVVIVCLILFFGAGFSIMAFNNDVNIQTLFDDISEYLTGEKEKGVKVLQLMYSVGIALGIIIFYNHFGAKKITQDPTPIEVEMREYEDEIYTALIEGHNRNDGKLDVK